MLNTDKMVNYKNWIFDWSGTLADDISLVVCATNYVMRVYGKPEYSREEFKAQFRLPYEEFYQEVLPGVSLPEIEDHFREGFSVSDHTVPLLPYAVDMLECLKSQGARIFILSSMDEKAFVEQSKELGVAEYFEEVYAGVLDKRGKIVEMMLDHDLAPAESVFVGDMIHDIVTAHHGGVDSIAVLTGYNTYEELKPEKPTYLVNNLSDVIDKLASMLE